MARDLAIAIPVRDAAEDLDALLSEVGRMGLFTQVVVSDDGSEAPCEPDPALLPGIRLDVLRAATPGGAGAARNRALDAVVTRDVLFFDADDRLRGALPGIAALHEAQAADFTIFRHADSRVADREGSFAHDEALWDDAAPEDGALARPRAARLARVAAYPWNKIYRADFLRERGIACSETPVHNDILLHWAGFLHAGRIAASRAVGALHVIDPARPHVTRRIGPERMCLFEPLDDVLALLRAAPDRALFTPPFVWFAQSVIAWNLHVLRGEVRGAFAGHARGWLGALAPAEVAAHAARRPEEAARLAAFLGGADAP